MGEKMQRNFLLGKFVDTKSGVWKYFVAGTEVRRFGSERPSFFTVDGETKKAEQPSFFTVGGEMGSLKQSNKQPEQVLGGNSFCTLRYPSGAPETAPHRGEGFREDVHFMGSHWNFRFKDRRKHTSGYEYGNLPRPKVATLSNAIIFGGSYFLSSIYWV